MGGDIVISFETLYDLLRREKNKEDLQKLEATHFEDVIAYLKEKQELLVSKADVDDLFTMGERDNIETEIKNIKKIIADLYERREKKIIDMALNKSRSLHSVLDTSALLDEETHIFDALLKTLREGRQSILAPLLRMQKPSTNIVTSPPQGESTPPAQKPQQSTPTSEQKKDTPHQSAQVNNKSTTKQTLQKVRITHPIPQFLGEELETYGPYKEGEIVELPSRIAKIVIDKERAIIAEEQLLEQK